jgi:hypothetical protein
MVHEKDRRDAGDLGGYQVVAISAVISSDFKSLWSFSVLNRSLELQCAESLFGDLGKKQPDKVGEINNFGEV